MRLPSSRCNSTHSVQSSQQQVVLRTAYGKRSQRPHALFLMGLPGAGKTTVKRKRMHRDDVDIEPDKFKRSHPRFSHNMSAETDDEVHRWSVRRSVDTFEKTVASSRKPNVVYDSSGSNASWMRRRIRFARKEGYSTELLWVDVPAEIAIFRNRNRPSRGHWCPEWVILDKAKVLHSSYEELKKEVDSASRVQNWSTDGRELEDAKEDIYIYPVPRTKPPGLRPGQRGYGRPPDGARSPSPTPGSMRSLRIGPWKRSDAVAKEKTVRLAWMDRKYRGNRERYVREHVMKGRDVFLEPNLFPYQLPPGMEHWTIWAERAMNHRELCKYIEKWLAARRPHNVVSWNYDDNRARRTIDIWHVHIYFQCDGPGLGGRLQDEPSHKSRRH